MRFCPFPCLLLGAILNGGCAFPTSPVPLAPDFGDAGQIALLGAGAAAGAILGDRLDGRTGAMAGGAAGLAGSALIERAQTAAASGEAVEQARREERIKIMQEYWRDRTLSARPDPGAAPAAAPLEYPAGTYSGINFGPRLAADSSLAEPDR
jgi:hypothetical protein